LRHEQPLAADPLGVLVVEADDLAVGGEIEIGLKSVGFLLDGQLERRQRVLGRIVRWATVGDNLLPDSGWAICAHRQIDCRTA
jgi:hypothetical protein